ncbi:MAG TPA: glycosyltransferase [Candidatus Blautia intestinavium]|nr:glycosyltransferase [Candidatus Blautia intestinavium]HJC56202.1 glycosyltransferase [Candidatus Eisenbergiella intestinipullorum]
MMVKVSVILPVYNVEQYLEQCLDSIVGQTLKDIEIICVDDGSTDNSLNILKNYQKKDPRIRLIEQKNAGAGAARNAGMRAACGQCLSFLDSDDFFEPDMLEKAYECLEQYQADFVVFDSDQFHMDKQEFVDVPWVFRKQEIPPYMPFSHRELTDNVFKVFVGWAWDKLYRRSFVEAHALQFQEQRTSNDLLFVFSALVLAKRIAVVGQVLAHQRRGSSTSLSVTREKSWHCFYDALTALRRRLVEEHIYWELEQDFINYALHFCLWNLNSLAEPTHRLLQEKLCFEWFSELGIVEKPESYFYSLSEYEQYKMLMRSGRSGGNHG